MPKKKIQERLPSQSVSLSGVPFDPTTLSHEQWEEMKNVDIRTVDKSTLVDLQDVQIDASQSYAQRMESFVRQIRNPYCFRVGDVAVKVKYQENGPSFEENLIDMLRRMTS